MRFGVGEFSRRGLRCMFSCAAFCLCSGEAGALTLGRPIGEPLIGRPLQIAIPASLADAEELACVQAELQQGSGGLTPLQWSLAPGTTEGHVIRLQSTVGIQEPVITVTLVVGCARQLTRGYVMLAELPGEGQVASAAAQRQQLDSPPPRARAASANEQRAPAAARAADQVPTASPVPAPHQTVPAPARPAGPAPSAPAVTRAKELPGVARLKLELLDTAVDQAPLLKLSMELAAAPAASAPQRSEAGAIREVTQRTPEVAAAQALRAPQREAELRRLRELQQRQDGAATVIWDSLQKAGEQRDLMLASAAALALLLGAMVWLGVRARRPRPVWTAAVDVGPAPPGVAAAAADWMDDSLVHESMDSVDSAPGFRDSATAEAVMEDIKSGGTRLATAVELLDMQEKADFFIAVGQQDRAIRLLEDELGEALGSSPFVWLDLLDLCRRLKRPADYERIRERFQKKFAAHLPQFDASHPESEGLVRYPRVLSRIQVLWTSPKVLAVIEEALFEDPAPGSVTFDLEASRDLLLLYSVVLEVLTGVSDEGAYEVDEHEQLWGPHAMTTEPVPLSVLGALDEEDAGPKSLDFDIDVGIDLNLDFVTPETHRQGHA